MKNEDTIEVRIELDPINPWADILTAELAELGFDGFMTESNALLAYCLESINAQEAIESTSLSETNNLSYSVSYKTIPYQNWNASWEADFEPVYVENYATIRAPFHQGIEIKGFDVVIQPKMSFGTGHHQTTWLMTKAMCEEPVVNTVLDMGTGTGVLAIIAEKLGAKEIEAVDIEEWSAENTIENAVRNNCERIIARHGDVDVVQGTNFEWLLANINKNVLKAHMPKYHELLAEGGKLFLSGFFISDIDEMKSICQDHGFKFIRSLTKDDWACLVLNK
ncbi:MAG: 50S ribosomal protein L11 methyltransferase [Crocinitomicaceae bacterium]